MEFNLYPFAKKNATFMTIKKQAMKEFYKNVLQKGDEFSIEDRKFFLIKNNVMPKSLFKYSAANEFFFKMLSNNQIYYASKDAFNDPLDGINAFKLKFTKADIDTFFLKLSVNETDPEVRKRNHQMLTKFYQDNMKSFEDHIKENYFIEIKQYGISCFTSKCDNFLMWSHYADNHKGVCVEFDFSKEFELMRNKKLDPVDSFLFSLRKVIYTDSIPEVDILEIIKERFSPVYHKAKNWEYEDEYRSVREKVAPYPFHLTCLQGVYFGCKTIDDTIERVKGALISYGYKDIFLKKMILKDNDYGLEATDITK